MKTLLAFLLLLSPQELETKHYRLVLENVDREDTGRLLEALHARLTKFFGKAPPGKLRLEVWATKEKWAASLRNDGEPVPTGAGGYYSPSTRKAYLHVQPSAYYTRQLLLHEATHQFHYLASTGNRSPGAFWYTEGLAEYFGMHNWDGKTLETGVVPAISLEDYPKQALANFDKLDRNLAGMISGKIACERPEAWALIHYMANKHEKRFRTFRKSADRTRKPDTAWRRSFGRVTPRLAKDYRNWILSHQQPWKSVWISWEQRGDVLEGRSSSNAIALLKENPEKLSVELDPPGEKYLGGLVFGFRDNGNFNLFQVNGRNEVRVMCYRNRKWITLHTSPRPPPDGKETLALHREGNSVALLLNGKEIGSYDAPGDVGLNVDSCTIRFHVRP
jgi:hypothetical protein